MIGVSIPTLTVPNGRGTGEDEWRSWPELERLDPVPPPAPDSRITVVAAHPDDEVLGAGGWLAQLARRHPIVLVWATDGEASHPNSTAVPADMLVEMRREESRRALVRLGIAPSVTHRLHLPDGRLKESAVELEAALRRIIQPDDQVLCTWRGDGHPDHEAIGEAVTAVTSRSWQFPVWMWEWAAPDDSRVPWHKARRVSGVDGDAKAEAISRFVSQVEPIGPTRADAAVLPPPVIDHFIRDFEVVFEA